MIIVDYGAGNLTSVYNALSYLGIAGEVSNDPKKIENAEKIIFPGVGAAKSAMETLNKTGIGTALKNAAKNGAQILGICIGCQIILEHSDENNGVECLGLLKGKVVRFANSSDPAKIKIPHIGWNQVNFTKPHKIFKGISNGSNFYFVHSYHPSLSSDLTFGTTMYGSQTFPCILGKDNIIATQFHLEKSGEIGLQVLKNFGEL